jgi:hypothetical protein
MRAVWRWLLNEYRSYRSAEERADALLVANLSPAQRCQLELDGCFEVIGSHTAARYRIKKGVAINIEQLDAAGACVRRWCFGPEGDLPLGDVLLAQKLALELFEMEALAIANRYPASRA